MLDLRAIREDPDVVRAGLLRRGAGGGPEVVAEILGLDQSRREAITIGDALRARRNEVSKTATWGTSGRAAMAPRMPARWPGVCSGARSDKDSMVNKAKASPRNYEMLKYLGLRARTT